VLFLVDELFHIFAHPSELGLALLVLSAACLISGRLRLGVGILLVPVLAGITILVLPIDNWILAPLETRFPKPQNLPPCIHGILMIGGGEDRRVTQAWSTPALLGDFGSFFEAARLMRAHPEAVLLFSGYGSNPRPMVTEAVIARDILVAMGVPPGRIELEQRSRDTFENFLYAKAIAQPTHDQVWVLVAQAAHIPRSMGIARHLGWSMIADPTGYQSAPGYGIPQAEFLHKMVNIESALHEWEGLIGYRLEGRIDTLFPAPGPIPNPQKSKSPQCLRAA